MQGVVRRTEKELEHGQLIGADIHSCRRPTPFRLVTPAFKPRYPNRGSVRLIAAAPSGLGAVSLRPMAAVAEMRPRSRHEMLPQNLPPRGLSREEAAAYVGVGATKFDQMVMDGRMPRPKRIDGRRVWDRHQLDTAFAALPTEDDNSASPDNRDIWSRVAV